MSDWNRKHRIMRHYDQSAVVYDTQYLEEQEAKIKAALTGLAFEKENVILDVGCGTGLIFPHVENKVKSVVGIDVSASITKMAKNRIKESSNSALIRADADNTPFPDEIFDTVFAVTLLQNTPKPSWTLKEMTRVAKQNATVVATGLKKSFSQKRFTRLLKEARLKTKTLNLDENLKDYVAICIKSKRKP